MKRTLTALCVITALSLTSCATIFTGTKDTISFNTNPDGAQVLVGGIERCTTPCSVPLPRTLSDKTVQLTKEGYEARTIQLDQKFNSVSILNLFGLVGWAVDAATGSLKKYDTKAYNIDLKKKD